MTDFRLLTTKKNAVFKIIVESSLNPNNFQWGEADSVSSIKVPSYNRIQNPVSVIKYKDSTYFYKFDTAPNGQYYSVFSPGVNLRVEEGIFGDWKGQLTHFWSWLKCLKKEIEEPDLWADLSKYQLQDYDQINKDIPNDQFSSQQVEEISAAINNIRIHLLKNHELDQPQVDSVNEKLNYLIDCSKRFGKKDWFFLSVGIITFIAGQIKIPQDQFLNILHLLRDIITGILLLPQYMIGV
jgi:hypothetical protein